MNNNSHKLDTLREALACLEQQQVAGGSGAFFDHEKEEKKSAVRKRALLLLDQRARSHSELRQRLLALEFDGAIVDDVLEDLTRSRLLDDLSFASEWVRQRAQRRGKSSKALDLELRDKGVDESTRARALAQIDHADERETAHAVAVKKARSETRIPEDRAEYNKALRRVVGALARRGFPSGLSMEMARQALDDRCAELRE